MNGNNQARRRAGSAREAALLSLAACETQGAWSDGVLKRTIREAGLEPRDAGLATRICYGVLQNRLLLDFWLARFCTVKLEKLEPKVRTSLRMGLYQIAFLDKIPASAAVNESVSLARKHSKNPRSAGLVNGVLRAAARAEVLPQPKGENELERLSLAYSHPLWLVQALDGALNHKGLEALLKAHNGEAPTTAQVNPLRGTAEAVLEELQGQGVRAEPHPWLENCLLLKGTGSLEQLPAFREGRITIQDSGARLAVLAAGVEPGMDLLDCCAAPGGKSFAAAMDMENQGRITACDIHPHKRKLLEEGAARLGISILKAEIQDGKEFRPEWDGRFQRVIADVPCSGLGIIRKKPDIRYKEPDPLTRLPEIQGAILDNVSRYVAPQGVLLYATCTVLERENEGVVRRFLECHPEFRLEAFELPGPAGRVEAGMITLWPHIHGTDGFFIARLRRTTR